jgi:cytidine deaminase
VNELSDLRAIAVDVSRHAYSPYSRFRVGAALRSVAGNVYRGCNVENASYGVTCCAERAALVAAVAAEGKAFRLDAVAVVAFDRDDQAQPAPPCGACRQALAEFGGAARVGFLGADGRWCCTDVAGLLPHSFTLAPDSAETGADAK